MTTVIVQANEGCITRSIVRYRTEAQQWGLKSQVLAHTPIHDDEACDSLKFLETLFRAEADIDS